MTRNEKAEKLRVVQLSDGAYFVESSEGKIAYRVLVNNGESSCSCADFVSNIKRDTHFQCKHILAVLNGNGNVQRTVPCDYTRPKLDERFISRIQGKEFVVYSGLLDLAHQRGLNGIEVEVVQYPTKDNGVEAICKATVASKTGETFIEWGDANPKNVNPKIAQHVLRMASTRAKARALRDFTNIGMTCLEELGDVDEVATDEKPGGDKAKRSASAKRVDSGEGKTHRQSTKADHSTPPGPEKPTTPLPEDFEPSSPEEEPQRDGPKPSTAQLKAIENLARRRNISEDELCELSQQNFGTVLANLTAAEASNFIRILQQSA